MQFLEKMFVVDINHVILVAASIITGVVLANFWKHKRHGLVLILQNQAVAS